MGRLSHGFYDLEFEFDCDAPKCEIVIRQPFTSSRGFVALFRSVVDGGMGRFFKLEEGTTLKSRKLELFTEGPTFRNGQWKHITCTRLRRPSGDCVASGPALPVLDVDTAGTSGESEREKDFKDGTWQGVTLSICLSPLNANGGLVPTVDKQTTYLYMDRMGTPPTGGEDDTRPWVVKVIKREPMVSVHDMLLWCNLPSHI